MIDTPPPVKKEGQNGDNEGNNWCNEPREDDGPNARIVWKHGNLFSPNDARGSIPDDGEAHNCSNCSGTKCMTSVPWGN